jgi:hypothetical protein
MIRVCLSAPFCPQLCHFSRFTCWPEIWIMPEVEGGRLPTSDWLLNLQILTSGGYQCVPKPPHH